MGESRIRYVQGHEVDKLKWDACVSNASNGLIFASKIFLDMLSDNWNAIIIDDYKAVMPLPWKKTLVISHYYRVPFLAQGGLFGDVDLSLYKQIRKKIFNKIKFGDLVFNFGNAGIAKEFSAVPATNMVLPLAADYSLLRKNYHRDLEKNLKRSARHEHVYRTDENIKLVIALFRKNYAGKIRKVRGLDFERFTGLCLHLQQENRALVRKITDGRGRLLAAALLFKDEKRIYNMLNVVIPEGKKKFANHFLFDNIVSEFSGSGLTLDFEGSEVPEIRKFYEHFGAANQPYYLYRNILP